MYHAVRAALAEAVASGALAGARLEEAADRVAGLRAWLADARAGRRRRPAPAPDARPSGARPATASGWSPPGARCGGPVRSRPRSPTRSSLRSSRRRTSRPAGSPGASPRGRTCGGSIRRPAAVRRRRRAGGRCAAAAIIAAAAGRPLVLAVRGALEELPLVSELLAARPDTVVVEMGIPAWAPPPGTAYLATYGASRACAQAAAEALGLARERSGPRLRAPGTGRGSGSAGRLPRPRRPRRPPRR